MGEAADLTRFDPFDPAIHQCPFPHYAAMREQQPVFRVPGTDLFFVTRHELIGPIARDHTTFSSRFATLGEMPDAALAAELRAVQAAGWPQVPTMLTQDPPAHTRYRSTVAEAFTPRRTREFEPAVRRICRELVGACTGAGVVEIVRQLAVPVPVRVIAHVLNVPDDRLDDFKRWSDDSTVTIGSLVDPETRLAAQRGVVEFQHYFADQLERRLAQPQDDVLTMLVQAQVDDDGGTRALDMAEKLSIVQQLLVAGNQTTTKMLTEAVRLLAEHPQEWTKLRDAPADRAAVVVEEVLRLATPTQGMFRVVTNDCEIADVPVPAGARLVVLYAAGNRDPAVFADPDRFDPDRSNHREHLAFGRGIHSCIGAPLARLEARVALEEIARAVAEIRLDPVNDFEYEPSFVLRGLKRLYAELVSAA